MLPRPPSEETCYLGLPTDGNFTYADTQEA